MQLSEVIVITSDNLLGSVPAEQIGCDEPKKSGGVPWVQILSRVCTREFIRWARSVRSINDG